MRKSQVKLLSQQTMYIGSRADDHNKYAEKVSGTGSMVVAGVIPIWPQGEKVGSMDVNEFTNIALNVTSNDHPIYPNLCGIEKVLESGNKNWSVIKVLLLGVLTKLRAGDKQESD